MSTVPVAAAEKGLDRSMMASHHPRGDTACPDDRFLILDGARVHGLALLALALLCGRVDED